MGFLKKIISKGKSVVAKAATGISKATTFVGKVTGNPIVTAVGNAASKMSTAQTVDNKESNVVSATTTTSATSSVEKNRGLLSSSGTGNFFTNLYAKAKDYMNSQKASNPILYYTLLVLLFGVVVLIVWLLWKYVISRFFGKKKVGRRVVRRTIRRSSGTGLITKITSSTNKKRTLSAAQRAALAKGRAALKRKRKR